MSRSRPSWNLDPATGKPVLGRDGRPARPSPLILPGAMPPAAVQAGPPPLDQLVPYLCSRGAVPQLKVGHTPEGRVFFVSECGPISIPIVIELEGMQPVCDAIQASIDNAAAIRDARQQPGLPEPPAGTADLLAEAVAAVRPAEACADA